MNNEQERAAFEAWAEKRGVWPRLTHEEIFSAGYQAGRAALQSQVKNDTTLFCDLKTDEEKSVFFLTGRGYETGVIARAIQNDVAMAYHRCAEYRKEMEALLAERDALREVVEHYADPNNWEKDQFGWKRIWREPGSATPESYDGYELAFAAVAQEQGGSDAA